MKNLFIIISLLIISSSAQALPQEDRVPGGLALIPLSNEGELPRISFNKKPIAIISEYENFFAMVGIPLNTQPGQHHIELRWENGRTEQRSFTVSKKTYKAQYLTIKNKRKVNPNKQDMERIISEKKRKTRARTYWSDNIVNKDFIIPVDGRVSSIYGLRRFFNNQPRRPHSGLDIAAPEGTPIKAVESGTVIESGDFFFSGNMVYIDHGQGLISMYAHMNRIDVKTGDTVNKGDIIGTVGQTGRVTGAHLHLSVIANQTSIDPVLLLNDLKISANTEY